MQRETLEAILGRAPGIDRKADARDKSERFVAQDEHEISVYIGRPGTAMALQGVLSVALFETHLEIEAKDRGTFYTTYEAVHAMLVGPRKESKSARGGVGF